MKRSIPPSEEKVGWPCQKLMFIVKKSFVSEKNPWFFKNISYYQKFVPVCSVGGANLGRSSNLVFGWYISSGPWNSGYGVSFLIIGGPLWWGIPCGGLQFKKKTFLKTF